MSTPRSSSVQNLRACERQRLWPCEARFDFEIPAPLSADIVIGTDAYNATRSVLASQKRNTQRLKSG